MGIEKEIGDKITNFAYHIAPSAYDIEELEERIGMVTEQILTLINTQYIMGGIKLNE